ncbi:hypothetical protein BRC64_11920 [Halobacteriales archaeon QH_10_67_22]|nr:MAG: hypothetical protein BRC64_11920 [Halobacteriales archaeon QH_10_67_22]
MTSRPETPATDTAGPERPLSAELGADVYLKREERVVMEGACGASLAGARAMADEIAGSTVVLQVSGRNVDEAVLRDILGW